MSGRSSAPLQLQRGDRGTLRWRARRFTRLQMDAPLPGDVSSYHMRTSASSADRWVEG
jgi:hypothetical protein